MAFERDTVEGGVEITVRMTQQELDLLKYVGEYCYDQNIGHQYSVGRSYGNPEEFIRKILYWEMLTVQLHSGEIQKYRLRLLLSGKDPNPADLRETNPELFVKSGGIIKDRKIPHFKPKFPALMHIH